MATINKKAGVLLTAATMALAVTGLAAPGYAQSSERNRPERAAPRERVDFGTQMRQMREAQAQRQRAAPQPVPQRVERSNPPRGNWQGQQGRPGGEQRPSQGWQRPDGDRGPNRPGWQGQRPGGEQRPPQGVQRPDNDRGPDRPRWQGQRPDTDRGPNRPGWQGQRPDSDRGQVRPPRGNDGRGDNDRWRNNQGWRDNQGWRNNNDRRDDNRWRGNDSRRGQAWNRNDWRRDVRYDWQRYRDRNRNTYRIGRYYAPYNGYSYRRLSIGFSLGSMFYGNRYWINDPWQYRLPPVYGPYRWVRYYDDVMLVDTYTGEVVDVIYDFFW